MVEEANVQEAAAPVPEVVTPEQLMAQLKTALESGDFKAVAQVSQKLVKAQKDTESAAAEAKTTALLKVQNEVKQAIDRAIKPIVDSGKLDTADGIWYTNDFGEELTAIRLVKTAPRAPRAGGGSTNGGRKFNVSTEDMLSRHGTKPYDENQTLQQAFDSSTEKNSRYGVRRKLLKLEGLLG